MQTRIAEYNGFEVAVVQSDEIIITEVQSAIDFIATIKYETGCNRIAINKSAFTEDFFQLSTRLAGEILQKFVNYHVKVAIIGDFSQYTSKALKDFIYECNHGKDVFFAASIEDAAEKLTKE